MLEVYFRSKKLQELCSSQRELQRAFGKDNAKKIMMRLTELRSVKNLAQISEVPPPRRHRLHGNREGQFAVDIKQPFRIVFEPYDCREAYDESGIVDASMVTKLLILDVEDYHGK